MINMYDSKCANFDNNGLVVLSETTSCLITEELNGLYELELTYPLDERGKWQYLLEENIIKADGQLFRIYRKVKTLSDIKINARHIFYDLLGNLIESSESTELSGASTLNQVLNDTQYPHNFTNSSDVGGIKSKTFTLVNPVEAIMGSEGIIATWGGELIRDNFTITLLEARGLDRGVLISYGKNIQGIEETLSTEDMCTRLMAIGKDNLMLPEKYIDSPYINNYPFPRIKTEDFFEIGVDEELGITEAMAIELLRTVAINYLISSKLDMPQFNYKIDFIELSKTEEYKNYAILESVLLGDLVTVKHPRLNIDLSAKVIKVTKNSLTNRLEKIELGSFKSNMATSITSIIQTVKRDFVKAKNYLDLQVQELDVELFELSEDLNKFSSDGYISLAEARTLKLDLSQLTAESEDVLHLAETLEIVTEKADYSDALSTLTIELTSKWIDQPNYPIVILPGEMSIISELFKNVQKAKSLLMNAIGKARLDDGKRYVEDQVTELNTALSAFQAQVNTYIKNGSITEVESNILDTLFVAVQTESDDVIAISDELKLIIDGTDLSGLTSAENSYKSAITNTLDSIDEWLDRSSATYPIGISVNKGKIVNNNLKEVELTKTALNTIIIQIRKDNELDYTDQQVFEANVAIVSMQMDIATFAKGNLITYDESVSLKASFDKIIAESADVIEAANTLVVSATIINAYQNSLTGTIASCGTDGLEVELAKWVDLSLDSYPKRMKTTEKKALLGKFKAVMSTKVTLANSISLKTPEYSIDGELFVRGTGANRNASRALKINKKTISASSASGRGLMLTVISRDDLSIIFTQLYDTFLDDTGRDALATKLDTLDDSIIVVLTSYNSIGWNLNLLTSVIRCGGTGTDTGIGEFPYALVGIPGIYKGTALEVFSSSDNNAPYADISTKIVDGTPFGIAMGSSYLAAEAQLAADLAQEDADAMNKIITDIAQGGKFTSSEKKTVLKEWNIIIAEKDGILSQGTIYSTIDYPSIPSARVIYQTKYDTLDLYISPLLVNMKITSIIDSVEFQIKFKDYFDARQALLTTIATVAKTYIDDAVVGLSEAIDGLAVEINNALSDGLVTEKESKSLATDLSLVIAESNPLIDIATTLGLTNIKPNEKTDYQDALSDLGILLNTWVGKASTAYPIAITASQKLDVQAKFENVQSKKSTLLNKISSLQVDSVKIGGRNLVVNSIGLRGTFGWVGSPVPVVVDSKQALQVDNSTLVEKRAYTSIRFNLKPNTQYVLSVSVKGDGNSTTYDIFVLGRTSTGVSNYDIIIHSPYSELTTTFAKSTYVFTTPSVIVDGFVAIDNNATITNGVNCSVWFSEIKLEEGNKATDWTAAPEDIDVLINTAQQDADTANALLADIADDSKITPVEKKAVLRDWQIIDAEYSPLYNQGVNYDLTTDSNNYLAMHSDLYNYLYNIAPYNTYPVLLTNMDVTTSIDGEYFRGKFTSYYSAKMTLLNKLAANMTVKEIVVPLYYPDNTSYVSTSTYTHAKAVRLGSSTLDDIITGTITYSNVLSILKNWPEGTQFAFQAALSSSGSGDYAQVELIRIDQSLLDGGAGAVSILTWVSGNNTVQKTLRTDATSYFTNLNAGDLLGVAFKANTSGYTAKLYKAELIIIPKGV